jgi:hypothetical protein
MKWRYDESAYAILGKRQQPQKDIAVRPTIRLLSCLEFPFFFLISIGESVRFLETKREF